MTLFVDASALVAIVAGEDDAGSLIQRVLADADPLWSAMSGWETVTALCRSHRWPYDVALAEVDAYAASCPFRLVTIGERERAAALEAYRHYGKGRHPAALNMGDCFAYACARTNGASLLYKGDDFSHTDLAR